VCGKVTVLDRGAHFYRTDLQVHSPRDRGWAGDACVTDQERKQYAASLIRACRQKGLQAIAITDHHDLLEQPHVFDGDGGLIGERRQKSDVLSFERSHIGTADHDGAKRAAFADQRHGKRIVRCRNLIASSRPSGATAAAPRTAR
jgi:hypothetical protein